MLCSKESQADTGDQAQVVDGLFVPDFPGKLLSAGVVDKQVKVIVAHNLDEGLLFTDPQIADDAGFRAYLAALMPSVSPAKISTLASQIYPPDFSGAQPYTDQIGRTKLAVAEGVINCFAFGVSLAYTNQTRAYMFSLFPGMHAQDEPHTFFNGDSADSLGIPISPSVAQTMQGWFVDFARLGDAAGSTATQIPVYTDQANVANIVAAGYPVVKDPAANSRCRYWLGLTA